MHYFSQRHIKNQALLYGWKPHTHKNTTGALYPVFDPLTGETIAQRYTVFTPDDVQTLGSKYLWMPRKPSNRAADWYILPARGAYKGAAAAIRAANGTAYLANGEKSLLAFVAAGVENVVATTHGEQTVPDLNVLKTLGVSTLINIYDADDAGRQAAQRWAAKCRQAGIRVITKRWPVTVQRGYDAADAWTDSQQQPEPAQFFRAFLEGLPTVAFETTAPKAAPQTHEHRDELGKLIIGAYERQHGPLRWKANGWSHNVHCPFHTDTNPSAGISRNGAVYCFVCGPIAPHRVAERLGIDVRAVSDRMFLPPARPSSHTKPTNSSPTPSEHAQNETETEPGVLTALEDYLTLQKRRLWTERPTIALFGALNTLMKGYGLIFLQLQHAMRTGEIPCDGWTIADAISATGRNRRTVQHFLTRMEGVLLKRMTAAEFFASCDDIPVYSIETPIAKNPTDASSAADEQKPHMQKTPTPRFARSEARLYTETGSLVGAGGRPCYYYVPTVLDTKLLLERLSYALTARYYGLKRHGDEMYVALAKLDEAFMSQVRADTKLLIERREALSAIEIADPAGAAAGRYAAISRQIDSALSRRLAHWGDTIHSASLFVPYVDTENIEKYTDFVRRYVHGRVEEAGALTIHQQALADELGVTTTTIRSAVRALDVAVTHNEVSARLSVSATSSVSAIQAAIDNATKRHHGRAIKWTISVAAPHGDIPVRSYPVYNDTASGIRKALADGARKKTLYAVDLIIRQPNTYSITERTRDPMSTIVDKPASKKAPATAAGQRDDLSPRLNARARDIRIPRYDDSDDYYYSGHHVAEQLLGLCGMMLVDGKARAIADWRIVVFDRVDEHVIDYLIDHLKPLHDDGEFPTLTQAVGGALPVYEYSRDANNRVVRLHLRDQAYTDYYPFTAAHYRALVNDEPTDAAIPF